MNMNISLCIVKEKSTGDVPKKGVGAVRLCQVTERFKKNSWNMRQVRSTCTHMCLTLTAVWKIAGVPLLMKGGSCVFSILQVPFIMALVPCWWFSVGVMNTYNAIVAIATRNSVCVCESKSMELVRKRSQKRQHINSVNCTLQAWLTTCDSLSRNIKVSL